METVQRGNRNLNKPLYGKFPVFRNETFRRILGMNEAAFSNCNTEDYINIDKDVQTERDTMNIDELVQNFRESRKGRKEEEEENDIVIEEEKCRVNTCQDAVKSLKELQEFAVQWNDSDMLSL
jgi:hypothetical protein